jgi:hypothetical protein
LVLTKTRIPNCFRVRGVLSTSWSWSRATVASLAFRSVRSGPQTYTDITFSQTTSAKHTHRPRTTLDHATSAHHMDGGVCPTALQARTQNRTLVHSLAAPPMVRHNHLPLSKERPSAPALRMIPLDPGRRPRRHAHPNVRKLSASSTGCGRLQKSAQHSFESAPPGAVPPPFPPPPPPLPFLSHLCTLCPHVLSFAPAPGYKWPLNILVPSRMDDPWLSKLGLPG